MQRAGYIKDSPERQALKAQRAELVKKITELNAKPLPGKDRQLHERFRKQDLEDLARKVLAIDKKLDALK